jgi:hypothetical protein
MHSSDPNGFASCAGAKLAQQTVHVILNGGNFNLELNGYLLIQVAQGNQSEDFELSLAETWHWRRPFPTPASELSNPFDRRSHNCRAELGTSEAVIDDHPQI